MKRRRWWIAAALGVGLVLLVLPLVAMTAIGGSVDATASQCPAAPQPVITTAAGLDASQLADAATIIAVGQALPGIGAAGEAIAVATSIVESGLRNLPSGDRDSLGLFQQRPSQGWGSPAQIIQPVYAATQFYRHLAAVPGWAALDPGLAAQMVQRSAFPGRYDAAMPLAVAVVGSARPSPGSGGIVVANCAAGATVALPSGVRLPAAAVAAIEAAPPTVQAAISYALAQVGKPYQWGSTGPDTFDCSGLLVAAYAAAGVSIPRTSQAEYAALVQADLPLLPGDLLFYEGTPPGHVLMYVGGGWMVEAPHTGTVVRVAPVYPGMVGAGRVVGGSPA